MKKELDKIIRDRKETLNELIGKFDYDVDKHRLNELEQIEVKLIKLLNERKIWNYLS